MPLNIARIEALAAADDPTIPDLSEQQIIQAATLLSTPPGNTARDEQVA